MSEKTKDIFYTLLVWLAMIAFCVVMATMATSCTTTKYVEVPVEHVVYVAKTDTMLKTDSVFCHDSVYVHSQGDTMYIERWHTKYKERMEYKVKTDSFIKVDSVAVPYPVEKKLSKWEQVKMDLGEYMVVLIVIFIIGFLLFFLRRTGKRGD